MSAQLKEKYSFAAKRGVTLIELLVVIAIIALIAAILIPVTQSVRTRAAVVTSQANLRQLGTLFNHYQADHDNDLPQAAHYFDGKRTTWDKDLSEYVSSEAGIEGLLHSPADDLKRRWANFEPRTYSMVRANGLGVAWLSYSANAPKVAHMNTILDPAKVLLLVEYVNETNVVFSDSNSVIDNPNQQLVNGESMYNGKFNYLYLDGHVDFLEPEATIGTGSMGAPGGAWTVRITD